MTQTAKTLAIITFAACLGRIAASVSGMDYTEQAMQYCTDLLYDMTECLRSDSNILIKIKQCDRAIANAVVCLSKYPDEDDDEVPHAHARTVEEEDVVVKRGLGRCINKCLQGRGGMTFIQCKSMCHR